MIDLATFAIGDPCPCGDGRLIMIDPKRDTFRCWRVGRNHIGQPSTFHTDHVPMPTSGPGFYTNLTNVAVTPPRGTMRIYPWRSKIDMESTSAGPVRPVIDRARYPHTCAKCNGAAYVGFTALEHAATGSARCP